MDNIETAPQEYWINCTYDEAILYCFSLNIDGKTGWRLPTSSESLFRVCWKSDRLPKSSDFEYRTIPVRDIS